MTEPGGQEKTEPSASPWIERAPITLSAGLDLADGEDRAIFRQRVWRFYHDTRLTFIQREAHEMGLRAPSDRASLMRLIADHWMRIVQASGS